MASMSHVTKVLPDKGHKALQTAQYLNTKISTVCFLLQGEGKNHCLTFNSAASSAPTTVLRLKNILPLVKRRKILIQQTDT